MNHVVLKPIESKVFGKNEFDRALTVDLWRLEMKSSIYDSFFNRTNNIFSNYHSIVNFHEKNNKFNKRLEEKF